MDSTHQSNAGSSYTKLLIEVCCLSYKQLNFANFTKNTAFLMLSTLLYMSQNL